MESPCRHVFCKICIETWLNNHHNCPTCRRSLRATRLKPVLPLVQNMINRLQMSCDFSVNGCKEILTLEQYDSHLKICDYEKLKCRFSKCGIEVLRKDLSEHEEDLCEYREKRCNKQCRLMIPISVFDSHDCFKQLQKFATESTALVETLKKSVKELTELTKTMKKNLEDLSRELQQRRHRSPYSSPSYSPYSFSSSGDESDLSNFILEDYSNERFDDAHNTNIPPGTVYVDQRNVRWRSAFSHRNGTDLTQSRNRTDNNNDVNTGTQSQTTSQPNSTDVNGNQVSSTAVSGDTAATPSTNTRSRNHIWHSDVSVLSSSSSSSSSSSDDDVDRDFGIEEDRNHENSSRYTYSSTPINSPNRSVRSRSNSGSTVRHHRIHNSMTNSRDQTMSDIYSEDESDRTYSSASSSDQRRTHHLSDYSSDQLLNPTRYSVARNTTRNHRTESSTHNSSMNQSSLYQTDPNSTCGKDHSDQQHSVIDDSSQTDDSKWEGNSIWATTTCNEESRQSSYIKTEPPSTSYTKRTDQFDRNTKSADRSHIKEESDQDDVIVVSMEKGPRPSASSASGGRSSQNTDNPESTQNNITGNKKVERDVETRNIEMPPGSSVTWPKKRKYVHNSSTSSQDQPPSKMLMTSSSYDSKSSASGSVDVADTAQDSGSHGETRVSVITSSHIGGESTVVISSMDSCFSSSQSAKKNCVTQLSNPEFSRAECVGTEFPSGNDGPEKTLFGNEEIDPDLTFGLRGYNSDTDDTWEPQESDGDYEMTPGSDTSGTWQITTPSHQLGTASNGRSQSESDDTWEPRIQRDNDSLSDDDDSYLSDLDIDTDSSYEVRIPMSVAQLLDKYASEDHGSDDSWTPH